MAGPKFSGFFIYLQFKLLFCRLYNLQIRPIIILSYCYGTKRLGIMDMHKMVWKHGLIKTFIERVLYPAPGRGRRLRELLSCFLRCDLCNFIYSLWKFSQVVLMGSQYYFLIYLSCMWCSINSIIIKKFINLVSHLTKILRLIVTMYWKRKRI